MQVHQIERDSTLQIPLDSIDRYLSSDIHDPAKADPRLRNRLIHALVLLDSFPEITFSVLFGHASVIRIARGDLERNVGGDDSRVVAVGFEEEQLEVGLLGETCLDLGASIASRVGGVYRRARRARQR